MNEITFRAVMDDGTTIEWEDPLPLPDGTSKPASIDDIDRSKLSNLLTVDHQGKVLHSIGFPSDERGTRLAVWRCVRMVVPGGDGPVTAGAVAGYNRLFPDGHSELVLELIAQDGTVENGSGYQVTLHPREIFSVKLPDGHSI